MKKIKKFFKKHYKRIITVFCVIISLFVFSISSFADSVPYELTQFRNVQMQLYSNSSHNAVTVRGYNPYFDNSNVNLKPSADFKFAETEKINFWFRQTNVEDGIPLTGGGLRYLQIPFDFAFAGKSLGYVKVVGFEVDYGYKSWSGPTNSWATYTAEYTVKPSYDNISVTRSNGQYFYSNGNKYPSYIFHIVINVPIDYDLSQIGLTGVKLTLEFEGLNNSSYTQFQMSNFRGFQWYSSLTDVPQNFQRPDDFEKVEIEDEKELTDNIVTDTEEGLDTFTEVVGGWRTQWGAIDDLSVCSVIWAQFLELRHISRLLYLSLAIGSFALVFNLVNMSSRFGGK